MAVVVIVLWYNNALGLTAEKQFNIDSIAEQYLPIDTTVVSCSLSEIAYSHFAAPSVHVDWEYRIRISIELPDTIYEGHQDIPIILKIENTTSEVLSIRNPALWGNAYPFIKQREMDISMKKVNPGVVFYDVIQIKGHEILEIKFNHTLDNMFNLGFYPLGKYDIYFIYYYEPKKQPEKKIFRKKNNPFIEEKYIISDVFTFYIHK